MRYMENCPANPFDFVNPISDSRFFAGRRKELAEAEYYLKLATHQRPVHCAVTGRRAAGKTSFLNLVQKKAEEIGILAARVDLTPDTVESELNFFLNVFEATLSAGQARHVLYSNVFDKFYLAFRQAVDMLAPPRSFDLLPLAFPFQYAFAKARGNDRAPVSQPLLACDLKQILLEARRHEVPAIVLLFDESDLFADNPNLLSKLRNLFTQVTGYMLVFSGTLKMFPLISDRFSPIVRQFRRIELRPFETEHETLECILQPLGVCGQAEKFDLSVLPEIHNITGGEPYEIRLICHFMYKHYQEKGLGSISLSHEVLDDVFVQLERLHSDEREGFLRTVRELPSASLSILQKLAISSPLSLIEMANGRAESEAHDRLLSLQELIASARDLAERSLITLDGNRLLASLNHDGFDRVYLKFLARARLEEEH